MSQITNLAYFYERSRKVRGGRAVWVKDSNGENRKNVLLGGTILNPNKGFGHLWAAQLVQYTPAEGCLIFRSFEVNADAASNATTIKINGDGFSDAPEVGQYLMIAPSSLVVDTIASESELSVANDKVDLANAAFTETSAAYKGVYAKVTAVEYDADDAEFTVTLANAFGTALSKGDILVEADAAADAALAEPTGYAEVLVPNPNTFIEADVDLLPTEGYGLDGTANYSISTVHDKEAWIVKMQPLPKYVLAKNRSYIKGIFWI